MKVRVTQRWLANRTGGDGCNRFCLAVTFSDYCFDQCQGFDSGIVYSGLSLLNHPLDTSVVKPFVCFGWNRG